MVSLCFRQKHPRWTKTVGLAIIVGTFLLFQLNFLFKTSDIIFETTLDETSVDNPTTTTKTYRVVDDDDNGAMFKQILDEPEKFVDVLELSRMHVEPESNITAAICYKTLFGYGYIDFGLVFQWAAFYRLLGFDRIFMFYRSEMEQDPRFAELRNLNYVTLEEYNEGVEADHFNQREIEDLCLEDSRYAASYDWALLVDLDEYLWFREPMGIKEYLERHAQRLTYISFGKAMYTLSHSPDMQATNAKLRTGDPGFVFSRYPFYMKNYCWSKSRSVRGMPMCPRFNGRAKVMVKPSVHATNTSHHPFIATHGTYPLKELIKDKVHLDTNKAHLKEWPYIFNVHNITQRPKTSFAFKRGEEVRIHEVERSFRPGKDGNYTMYYDSNLVDWFRYVLRRGPLREYATQLHSNRLLAAR